MNPQKSHYFDLPLELKLDGAGEIEGYGAVFGNRDQGGDIVEAGAFTKSLTSRKPKMLWQHDPEKVIGVWTYAAEDQKGLLMKGRIVLETEAGREAHALLKAGAIDGLSIGYRTKKTAMRNSARSIIEADLWEVSLVTFPMNERATVESVKSLTCQDDVERLLRKTGLPWGACKKLAAGGWPALRGEELTETEAKLFAEQLAKVRSNLGTKHNP